MPLVAMRRHGAGNGASGRISGVVTVAAWTKGPGRARASAFPAVIYLVAFVTGAIVMSFEMLGSRYLNPYFGSGIYTWASLISTVLAALCVGYFIGGMRRTATLRPTVLGVTVLIGSAYILVAAGVFGAAAGVRARGASTT